MWRAEEASDTVSQLQLPKIPHSRFLAKYSLELEGPAGATRRNSKHTHGVSEPQSTALSLFSDPSTFVRFHYVAPEGVSLDDAWIAPRVPPAV